MDNEVIKAILTVCQRNNLWSESVESNSLIAIRSKDERLTMFQKHGVLDFRFLLCVCKESPIIEYIAVLINLDKRSPLVFKRGFDNMS